MSFSWAITDKRYEHQPWKKETFRGYFTDIRRAARKSLPRRPDKDLRKVLGLALSPRSLEQDVEDAEKRLSESASNAPVSLKPVVIRTADRPPDISTNEKRNGFDKLKALLLCRTSRTENCSKREKTVFGFAIYFAIIVFILLIIVLILSTTLSRLNDDDASDNNRLVTDTSFSVTTPETTSLITGTTVSLSSSKTTAVRTTSSNSKITSKTSSTLSSSTKTSPTTDAGEISSKTAITTTVSVSATRGTSPILSTTSSMPTSATPSKTSSIKTVVTSNSKSTQSSSSQSLPPSSSGTSPITTPSQLSSLATSSSATFPSIPSSSATTSASTESSDPIATTMRKTSISTKSTFSATFTASAQTSVAISTTATTTESTSESILSPTSSSSTVEQVLFPTLERPDINCTSSVCLAVNKTLNRADFDKSPCVDFYEFSCGQWSREWMVKRENGSGKNIPESVQEELRQSLLLEIKDILQKTYREDESFSAKVTKRLFQSCVESNEENQIVLGEISRSQTMQEVHALLDPLGMQADGSIQNTQEALLKDAVTRFEVTPFFTMSPVTTLDQNGIKVHALKIEPPSVYLDYNAYRQPVETGKESFKYVEGMSQVLNSYISSFSSRRKRQTQGGSSISTPEMDEIFNNVLRTYYIEANISSFLGNSTSTVDQWYSTLYYTYSELKVIYSFIDWDAAIGHDRNFLVHLVDFGYFQNLNNLWRNLNEDDMKLYVFMNVLVKRVWTYMKLPFRRLLSNVGANGDMVYTDIDCVQMALSLASEEIHALYIGQFTQNVLNNRLKLTNLKNKVSEAFQKYVSAANWIQPDLERAVTSLARNLKLQFSALRANVRQTRNITGGTQSFLSLSLELHGQKYRVEMNRLGSEVTDLVIDWTSTRPQFDEYFNAIGIPTGLTVYLTNGDLVFDLYGSVGMVMAEEFIRVLTGPMRGGSPPQWWGPSNMIAFDTVIRCFSSQLSTLQNTFYDVGNVIMLNGAFQVIDQVYLSMSSETDSFIPGSNLTENMIFILNIAQLHCQLEDGSYKRRLTKERMNNVLMNNINFKRMFACPDVSPMVAEDTCSLFP